MKKSPSIHTKCSPHFSLQLVSQKQSKPTLLNTTKSHNHQFDYLLTWNIINRVGHCLHANRTNKLHDGAKTHQTLQQPHPPWNLTRLDTNLSQFEGDTEL